MAPWVERIDAHVELLEAEAVRPAAVTASLHDLQAEQLAAYAALGDSLKRVDTAAADPTIAPVSQFKSLLTSLWALDWLLGALLGRFLLLLGDFLRGSLGYGFIRSSFFCNWLSDLRMHALRLFKAGDQIRKGSMIPLILLKVVLNTSPHDVMTKHIEELLDESRAFSVGDAVVE